MALVEGTNAGLVTIAPTEDPDTTFANRADERTWGQRVLVGGSNVTITEIGWY